MKKIIIPLTFLFFSCQSHEIDSEVILEDSTIINSQKILEESKIVSEKSDSATKNEITKIVKEFVYLNNEVEKFKTERLMMLNEIKFSKENVIIKTDTVYIETKRNFWGKEKTTTSVKSDSIVTSNIDSVLEKTEKIDTISNLH